MSEYVDRDGYPTEAITELLAKSTNGVELVEAAAEYFNASGYGRAWKEGRVYKFATGGWSGCEEVASALMSNLFAAQFWESTHRGGLHVFEMPESTDA
jgi:hypothetical protein